MFFVNIVCQTEFFSVVSFDKFVVFCESGIGLGSSFCIYVFKRSNVRFWIFDINFGRFKKRKVVLSNCGNGGSGSETLGSQCGLIIGKVL